MAGMHGKSSEALLIAGYPIAPGQRVFGVDCPLPAQRHDWNEYVGRFQTCPVTDTAQSMCLQ